MTAMNKGTSYALVVALPYLAAVAIKAEFGIWFFVATYFAILIAMMVGS